jgi:DNA-binding transcriptional MerR regulator
MDKLLTPAEVIKLLDVKRDTFFRYQRRGFFRPFESDYPMGERRYIKARLEAWLSGGGKVARKRSA